MHVTINKHELVESSFLGRR